MYFVNREEIEENLIYLEEKLSLFGSTAHWETEIEKMALERIAHTIIESILDVGNAMIDGFIMRDPGSYEDIIDILLDEKVVEKEDADSLKKVIHFRKDLVQHYLSMDHQQINKVLAQEKEALHRFAPKVRIYLENELGPVSAFRH
ncbi:DUF86 domain-containing protein [Metabacillus arenae]|uniref:DUF86 domain-containing protein n=1 Tax=Metabacillus arenae TaxID=2771434 RepID=A0A926NHD5_9BACI|nr:DUF86 domain-containing protein [Metabacillus arenae]MBD1380820.1 DUF86 domain-containing protein [Metabacillus arenae]